MTSRCRVPRCDREVWAVGMCLRHYRQDWRGTLDTAPTPEVGSPSGHGRYGLIDGDDDMILCHECGKYFRSVGGHIYGAHGIRAAEYKERHGIPRRVPLAAPSVSRAISEAAQARVGTPGWERMVARRDPTAASHARTRESFIRRGQDADTQVEVAVKNAAKAPPKSRRPCRVCGGQRAKGSRARTCSPLCAAIMAYESKAGENRRLWVDAHQRGEDAESIATRHGVKTQQVTELVAAWERNQARRAWLSEHGPGEVPDHLK